jgi:two-component system NtrC family sensor kinase
MPPHPTAPARPLPGLRARIALAGAAPLAAGALACALLPFISSGVNEILALATAGVVAGLGALSVGLLLRSVVQPITRFTDHATELTKTPGGVPSERLRLDETPELSRLAASINDMMDALEREGARVARLSAESNEQVRRRAEDLDAAEAALAARRGELQDAVRLGRLVSRVAHDLNNPLATISGYTELLEGRPDMSAEARQRLAVIRAQADRCRRMLRDLLVFVRKVKLNCTRVSLNELLHTTTEAQRSSLLDWGIEPDVALDADDPAVSADRLLLEQVLVHLMTNARDALNSRPGTKTLQMKTRITGDEAQIVVMDNGPGLPAPLKDTLFAAPEDRPGGESAGLGLSFCQGIIQEHHGRIQAFNRPGGGASFVVSLPLVASQARSAVSASASVALTAPEDRKMTAPRTTPAAAPLRAGGAPDPLRVLVVDDEPEIANLIEEALSDEGHSVTKALNGTRALDCLATGEFDLIVSDMRMPGMNGMELHEQVSTRWPGMLKRLVFITGDQSGDDTTRFLQMSGARCLGKPFRVSELQQLMRDFSPRAALAGGE